MRLIGNGVLTRCGFFIYLNFLLDFLYVVWCLARKKGFRTAAKKVANLEVHFSFRSKEEENKTFLSSCLRWWYNPNHQINEWNNRPCKRVEISYVEFRGCQWRGVKKFSKVFYGPSVMRKGNWLLEGFFGWIHLHFFKPLFNIGKLTSPFPFWLKIVEILTWIFTQTFSSLVKN